MDLLTHAALGAAGATAIAPARQVRVAALIGSLSALLPDADALIASSADPLLTLEYHRHFTHALVFVPVGALIAASLLWLALRRRIGFAPTYRYAFVGYLLSPLLDACTSYGTHLLWPFSERPIAWSIIPIVDPLFTLTILIALGFALWRMQVAAARIALVAAMILLAVGYAQHQRALSVARELAQSRGHVPERMLVKPTLANLLLWRSVYIVNARIHVDAVRVGLPGSTRVYAGQSAPRFDSASDADGPPGSVLRADIARFVRFTDGFPVRHPERTDVIGDARYALLPTSMVPLWGIVIDPSLPQTHARFETFRNVTPEVRARFLEMLLGRN